MINERPRGVRCGRREVAYGWPPAGGGCCFGSGVDWPPLACGRLAASCAATSRSARRPEVWKWGWGLGLWGVSDQTRRSGRTGAAARDARGVGV